MIGTEVEPNVLADELRPRLNALTVLLRREGPRGLSPSQTAVLYALRDGAARRMSELADGEGVTQPTMSVVVRRLEEHGWVRRAVADDDRRVTLVTITKTGAALLQTVATERSRALGRRLAALDDADRAALAAALPALDRLLAGGR